MKLEKFTVTGSYIPQASSEPVGPVSIFSETDIRATGAFTPIEALRSLPSFIGNPGPTEFDSNGGNGSTGVSLRGLGVSQTLILIDGRVTGQFSNLQLIPIEAIDRIEVLRDGAGVIYGSAAIAGAVNVILKKNFTGSVLDFSGGAATRSPGSRETFQAAFVAGAASGGTSLMLSGSYSTRRTIYASQRPNSAPSDGRPRGGINGGSPTYPGVIQINGGGSPMVLAPGFSASATPTLANYVVQDQNTFSSNQLFNFRNYSPSTPGQDRNSLFVNFEQNIIDQRLTLFASLLWAKLSTSNGLAPAPFALDSDPASGGTAVGSLNQFGPYNPGLLDGNGDFFRYRSIELGNRTNQQTFTDHRWQVGLKGAINDNWNWEAAMTAEYENYEQIDAGVPSLELLDQEVLAGNFNPFAQGFSKGTSAAGTWDNEAALKRAETKARIVATAKNRFYDARVNGSLVELPAGDLGFAAGVELQDIKTKFDPDDLYSSGGVLGLNSFTDSHNAFTSTSYFAEIKVPLLSEKNSLPYVHSLTLGAVARHEDQTIKGDNSATGLPDSRSFKKVNPSVTLRYSPTKDYLIRASWSKGFVAPGTGLVFGTPGTNNPTLVDPLGYPYKAQTTVVVRTNPSLQSTLAEATSLGLVATPGGMLKGFSFNVDYYHSKVTGIPANNANVILAVNAAGQGPGYVPGNAATLNPNAPFAGQIHRLANGNLRDTGAAAAWTQFGIDPAIRGAVLSDYLNIGARNVQGVEYAVSYDQSTQDWGHFKYVLEANQFLKFDQTNGPGLPTVSYLGKFVSTVGDPLSPGSIPRWKGNFGTTWTWKNFTTNAKLNYVGSYQDDPLFVLSPKMAAFYKAGTPKSDPAFAAFLAATSSVDPKVGGIRQISAFPTFDLQVAYAFGNDMALTKGFKVTLGATNLFDKLAPFAAGAFNDSYDTRTVNNVGRFIYMELRKQF